MAQLQLIDFKRLSEITAAALDRSATIAKGAAAGVSA